MAWHPEANICSWDCGYYRSIWIEGYELLSQKHSNLAFFPGFPLLVGIVSELFGASFAWTAVGLNLLMAGLLFFLTCFWCHGIGLRKFFWLPGLLWFSDRFSFWTHVPYTETLFMLGSLAFLLLLRAKELRKKWWVDYFALPLVAGALSSVKLLGVSAVASWGWGEWRKFLKQPFKGIWVLVLGLIGIGSYWGFLHLTQGSWSVGMQATSKWGRHFEWAGFFKSVFFLLKSAYFPTLISLIGGVWILVKPPGNISMSPTERWFFALLLVLPMTNSITISLTRYLSILLPAYVLWASVLEKRGWTRVSVPLLALFVVSELYWQVLLTRKFINTEAFNWAG